MFAKVTENGTKKPSAKPRNRVPMVKVLNYLKNFCRFPFIFCQGTFLCRPFIHAKVFPNMDATHSECKLQHLQT